MQTTTAQAASISRNSTIPPCPGHNLLQLLRTHMKRTDKTGTTLTLPVVDTETMHLESTMRIMTNRQADQERTPQVLNGGLQEGRVSQEETQRQREVLTEHHRSQKPFERRGKSYNDCLVLLRLI